MTGENLWVKPQDKVAVIGLGFVGLPLALAFTQKGFEVIGIELDKAKINNLKQGKSYIQDIKNEEVHEAVSANKLAASNDYYKISAAESIIICVPTPLTPYHTPDLSYITDSCLRLVSVLRKGQLIVLESSSFPGTTREVVLPILEKSGLKVGEDIFLAYSPERVDPGSKLPIAQIPKIISGVSAKCLEKASALYQHVFEQVVAVSTTEAAETTMLLENTFRLVNVSFINEFAKVCDTIGVDIWEVIDAASTKPYGFMAFYPGPGAGGHCIPVDPLYLQWKASLYGMESQFIAIANRINETMPKYIWNQIKFQLFRFEKPQSQLNVLIYGVTYKKDTADIRESSALALIELMQREGVNVSYHDPFIPALQIDGVTMHSVNLTPEILQNSDCVVIHTDHTGIPIPLILEHSSLVFDTRNAAGSSAGKAKVIKIGGGRC